MMQFRVEIGACTDVGGGPKVNEDSFRIIQPTNADDVKRRGILLVIADGMGGHNAGEIASRLAVQVVGDRYADETKDPGRALEAALEEANREIAQAAASDARYKGMGTTCTALLLREGLAYCAHVGDSRVYRARGNDIIRMTEDHSAVMDLVRKRSITHEQARFHPDKNVIVRALGIRQQVKVSTWAQPLPIRAGDTFLVCSDGLYDVVEDHEFHEALRASPPQHACERLVQLARSRGGPDNITVAIVAIGEAHSGRGRVDALGDTR